MQLKGFFANKQQENNIINRNDVCVGDILPWPAVTANNYNRNDYEISTLNVIKLIL